MNRFKFRVFSTVTKRYTDIGLSTALAANSVSNNQFVIQQCLGVTDKNGRYIYEGDIVTLLDSLGEIIYCTNDCSFFVKLIQSEKYTIKDSFYDDWGGEKNFNWNQLQVVGSIVDEYFISLNNVVSKLPTPNELIKQLTEGKTT